jgi:hypothetical protein
MMKIRILKIQYFDDNTFRIENTSTEMIERASILCTFGKIHHSCKQYKLSGQHKWARNLEFTNF